MAGAAIAWCVGFAIFVVMAVTMKLNRWMRCVLLPVCLVLLSGAVAAANDKNPAMSGIITYQWSLGAADRKYTIAPVALERTGVRQWHGKAYALWTSGGGSGGYDPLNAAMWDFIIVEADFDFTVFPATCNCTYTSIAGAGGGGTAWGPYAVAMPYIGYVSALSSQEVGATFVPSGWGFPFGGGAAFATASSAQRYNVPAGRFESAGVGNQTYLTFWGNWWDESGSGGTSGGGAIPTTGPSPTTQPYQDDGSHWLESAGGILRAVATREGLSGPPVDFQPTGTLSVARSFDFLKGMPTPASVGFNEFVIGDVPVGTASLGQNVMSIAQGFKEWDTSGVPIDGDPDWHAWMNSWGGIGGIIVDHLDAIQQWGNAYPTLYTFIHTLFNILISIGAVFCAYRMLGWALGWHTGTGPSAEIVGDE